MQNHTPTGISIQEEDRLQALYAYGILDTGNEAAYDALLNLTVSIFKVPVATITFVDRDRLWFKSTVGITQRQADRVSSFCHHTVQTDQLQEIQDTHESNFSQMPLVTQLGVRYYAGAPLISPDGFALGTLCLFDLQPRHLTLEEKGMLQTLAQQVITQLELDARRRELEKKEVKVQQFSQKLDTYRAELDQIAYSVSHELKSPLRAIHNLAEWVVEDLKESESADVRKHLSLLQGRVQRLENLFNGLITYSKARRTVSPPEQVDVQELLRKMANSFQREYSVQITLPPDLPVLHTEKPVLETIFYQLLQNAVRHNKGMAVAIEIGWHKLSDAALEFDVQDNGVGIAPEFQEQIFGMFKTIKPRDEEENTGIGLALVKRLLAERQATIRVDSQAGHGSRFTFIWPL